MDLLAKKRVLFVLMLIAASRASAESTLYQLSEIDYFAMHAAKRENQSAVLLWENTSMPPLVRDLLDHPNEETARHYMDWNQERLKRIAKAQAVIDALSAGEEKL